ncbi:helix-turn-helix transcriptional regulator [Streptomyces sp. RM1]
MADRRNTVTQAEPRALPSRFLTPEDLVEMFELPSVETVYQWRRKRTGPRGFRVGRHLRFDPEDVRAWVDAQLKGAAA